MTESNDPTEKQIKELLTPDPWGQALAKVEAQLSNLARPILIADLKHGEFKASTEVNGRKVPKRYVDLEAEICGAASESFAVGSDDWAIFVRFHMVAVWADALTESITAYSHNTMGQAARDYANLARAIQYELEISEDI